VSQGLSGVRQAGKFASSPLSKVRAVCVNAPVRICAGGDQRWSSLPRQCQGRPGPAPLAPGAAIATDIAEYRGSLPSVDPSAFLGSYGGITGLGMDVQREAVNPVLDEQIYVLGSAVTGASVAGSGIAGI
jgi:hypothetical protein